MIECHVGYTRFRRQLTQVIEMLQDRDKIVVTKHGQPEFVVMTLPEYNKLKG